jgi:hypothetical protein
LIIILNFNLFFIFSILFLDLKHTIKTLEDFEDGGKYLCCGGEKPAETDKLPAAMFA